MARSGVGNESGQMKTKRAVACFILGALSLAAALLLAETPSANPNALMQLTATTANVSAPDSVRIEILRWSTDDERERLMAAWDLKSSAGTPGLDKGAGKQGRGAGKGRGPTSESSNNTTPEASLARALNETTTVGYLWSSEVAGYALRYAGKVDAADGSRKIILITRRLGAVNQRWNPTFQGTSNSYDFSVIELRLNAKGEGEGRASLVGKVAPDVAAKIVTLENYDALPAVFHTVRMSAGNALAKKP